MDKENIMCTYTCYIYTYILYIVYVHIIQYGYILYMCICIIYTYKYFSALKKGNLIYDNKDEAEGQLCEVK